MKTCDITRGDSKKIKGIRRIKSLIICYIRVFCEILLLNLAVFYISYVYTKKVLFSLLNVLITLPLTK